MSVTEQELEAAAVAPRVTKDRIEARIASTTFHRLTGTLTMCVLELENGFTVTGQSACASPANFNQEIGERLAREDAFDKIWALEGYLLRELLWREDRDGKFARMDAEMRVAGPTAPTPKFEPGEGMVRYIGTKIVDAKPMDRFAYNELRGWKVPDDEEPFDDGYLVEYTDQLGSNVEGFRGYVSWSPKAVFDAAYGKLGLAVPVTREGFMDRSAPDIGFAMSIARNGGRAARRGWNGTGMFIYYVPPAEYPANRGAMAAYFGADAMVPYNGYLALKGVDGKVSTWAPSVSDALATDWYAVDDQAKPEHPPHVQRMVDEYLELTERLANLQKFVGGAVFAGLYLDEQTRLGAQLEAMNRYHAALAARLMAAGVSF